jgi:hypothetical protein
VVKCNSSHPLSQLSHFPFQRQTLLLVFCIFFHRYIGYLYFVYFCQDLLMSSKEQFGSLTSGVDALVLLKSQCAKCLCYQLPQLRLLWVQHNWTYRCVVEKLHSTSSHPYKNRCETLFPAIFLLAIWSSLGRDHKKKDIVSLSFHNSLRQLHLYTSGKVSQKHTSSSWAFKTLRRIQSLENDSENVPVNF